MSTGMPAGLHQRYAITRRLSRGGMAEVFVAETVGAQGFRKPVVLKRIIPDQRDDPTHRRAFVREAKLLARLMHPNIVQVIELAETENELFIVMELVRGLDLARLSAGVRESGQSFDSGTLAVIAFDVLEGLTFAHTATDELVTGVVHADVSPQNILIATSGHVKLCDFGIARVGSGEGPSIANRGKLAYMAPEQLRSQPVDTRTDLYALGVVLYECASGAPLFTGRNVAELIDHALHAEVPPLSTLAPRLDPRFCEAIDRALLRSPEQRFQSADAFRLAIEPVLESVGPLSSRARLRTAVRALAENHDTDDPPEHTTSRWRTLTARETAKEDDAKPASAAGAVRSTRYVKALLFVAAIAVAGIVASTMVRQSSQAPAASFADLSPPPVVPTVPETVFDPPETPLPQKRIAKRPATTRPAPRVDSVPSPKKLGYVTLNAVPWAYVTIDGARLDGVTPMVDVPLSAGAHTIMLQTSDGRRETRRLVITGGERTTQIVRFE